ncbi:arginyl-tRNA--protein transferase 1 isoform X2 [Macrobrachium rosenbergii]|uniref:arginyl-tRNA--protein transferase 1 isoform X2 n=1 Tax=Macrobrachium rosenbergii TaxID=79674 RepID=UPI0034D50228
MAEERDPSFTILEYTGDHSAHKCGYCKSVAGSFSHGMWAHRMAVGDYQDLIDRGWRRSGKYCYKPTMNRTCCPLYTIRCDASEIRLTKGQKKVLKRVHRYLSHGDIKPEGGKIPDNEQCVSPTGNQEYVKPKFDTTKDLSMVSVSPAAIKNAKGTCTASAREPNCSISGEVLPVDGSVDSNSHSQNSGKVIQPVRGNDTRNLSPKSPHQVAGPDPSKPPCRKSKLIRLERREAKLAKRREEASSRGESLMEVTKSKSSNNTPKSLEDFLNEPLPESPAHKLELKLVRVNENEPSFRTSYRASYAVYRKYQLEIHHDWECDRATYKSFLVEGPLVPWHPGCGPLSGYGSFHHQYWLDDRLIAVGVLDILPHCVSSVYLYYDPEFSFLSLGTYASLRELALTRELQRTAAALKWYYMGFYIHSCPKMRYKGNYSPSFLLCPETYIWVPIEKATPKLDLAEYSRLNEDTSARDYYGEVDLNRIKILYDQDLILYEMYQRLNPKGDDEDEVKEYASLVGAKSAHSMVLYRG